MANHEKLEVVNGIINIVVLLAGAFAFIFLESTGLALAILVTALVLNVIKSIEIFVIYRTNPYPLKLIVHLLILITVSSLAFYLVSYISNSYVLVIVDCVVGISLIVLAFIVNPNKDDKYFFSNRTV